MNDVIGPAFGPMVERECTSKTRYSSVEQAQQEARIIFSEGGPQLRVYECCWCYGTHLTKQPG